MAKKPAFNPNAPFEAVTESKPAFDPNLPFEEVDGEPSKKKISGNTSGSTPSAANTATGTNLLKNWPADAASVPAPASQKTPAPKPVTKTQVNQLQKELGKVNPLSRIELYSNALAKTNQRYDENLAAWKAAKEAGDTESEQQLAPLVEQERQKSLYFQKAIEGQKQLAEIKEPNTALNALSTGFKTAVGTILSAPQAFDKATDEVLEDIFNAAGMDGTQRKAQMDQFRENLTKKGVNPMSLSDELGKVGVELLKEAGKESQEKRVNLPYQGQGFEALKNGDIGLAVEYGSKSFLESLPSSVTFLNPVTAAATMTGMVGEEMRQAEEAGLDVNSTTVLAGTIKAGLELATERMFGAGRATKELIESLGKEAAEKVVKDATEQMVKKALVQKLGQTYVEEIGGEIFNQIGSNAVDKYINGKNVGLTDGVGEAGWQALFGAGIQGTAPVVIKHNIDMNAAAKSEGLKAQANDLMEEAINQQDPNIAEVLEAKAEKLNDESNTIINEVNKIGDNAKPETVQALSDISDRILSIDQSLTSELSDVAKEALVTERAELEKQHETLLEQAKTEANEPNRTDVGSPEATGIDQPATIAQQTTRTDAGTTETGPDIVNSEVPVNEQLSTTGADITGTTPTTEPIAEIQAKEIITNEEKTNEDIPENKQAEIDISDGQIQPETEVNPELTERAATTLQNSIQAYNDATAEEKTTMVEKVESELEKNAKAIESIGVGLDTDMVAAGVEFLKQVKPESKFIPVEKGVLSKPEKTNLEKMGAETGVNFREIANVYAKYGEGKPLSEITTEDYKAAQANREKVKSETKKESPPIPDNVSGIKKALVPESKIEETEIERQTNKQILNTGREMVDAGEINPTAIIEEINEKPRALQPEEVAALIYYKSQIDKQYNKVADNVAKYKESGDTEKEITARAELAVLDKTMDAYHEMVLKTAQQQSLAFRLRQALVDSEFNLQTQIRNYKKVNNGTIPASVLEKFQEYDQQIKDLNKKIDELNEKQSIDEGQEAVGQITESVDKEFKKPKKPILSDKEKARKKELLNKFLNRANDITNIATLIADKEFYEYAGLVFKETSGEFKEFAKSMMNTVGKGLRDYLPDLYKKLGGKDETTFEYDDIEIKNGKLKIPKDLIRDLVASGYDKIETLTDEIHDRIKEELPDVTKRNVRDAITEYGKTINMSQEELDVTIRGLKRMGKLISGLEDVQAKIRPLRSGLQRDKLTQEERRLQKAIKEGLKDIPVSQEESNKAWKTALDAVKSRLTNQIEDLEKQIATGEKTPKKEGIKYDAEALALQAKRDALKETIERIEGKPKISDEQRLRMAVTSVEKSIAELERRIKEGDTTPVPKRTPASSAELDSLKEKRKVLREAYTQMEKDMGVAEQKKLDNYKKGLSKSIKTLEKRIADKDFVPKKKATKPVPDAEARKLEREKLAIQEKYDIEIEKARLANRPLSEKIRDTYVDILGIPKSLMSTLDFSAPLRQGAVLSYSNPKIAAKAFIEMFKYFKSEQKFKALIDDIRESDKYTLIRNSKLYLSEPNARLSAKEEDFVSNFANRIPIYGKLVKASERAYVGYLNKIRLDVFTKVSDALIENGYDPNADLQVFKDLASYINNATGRGNLGAFEKSADLLNTAFFSPRYVASRLNLLWPPNYLKMSRPVQKEALRSTLTYLAAWGALNLLWAVSHSSDAEDDDPVIEMDPRSSDFGKLRLGRTRYDVSAGFGPIIVFLARMLPFFGGIKNVQDREVTKFGDEDAEIKRSETIGRFIRSKTSPVAGTLWDFADGETFGGEPVDRPSPLLENITGKEVPYSQEALEKVMPLYINDFYEIAEEEGFGPAAAKMAPSFFGVGVQHYKE